MTSKKSHNNAATPAADTQPGGDACLSAEERKSLKRLILENDIFSYCRLLEIFQRPERPVWDDCRLLFLYYSFRADLTLIRFGNGRSQLYVNGIATPISGESFTNALIDLYKTAHAAAGDRAVRPLNAEDLSVLRDYATDTFRRARPVT